MAEYIRSWAETHPGFEAVGDAAGNLCVRVPATVGSTGASRVILQGHLDMVCTRDETAGPNDPTLGKIQVIRATQEGERLVGAQDGEWSGGMPTSSWACSQALGRVGGWPAHVFVGRLASFGLPSHPSVKIPGILAIVFQISIDFPSILPDRPRLSSSKNHEPIGYIASSYSTSLSV